MTLELGILILIVVLAALAIIVAARTPGKIAVQQQTLENAVTRLDARLDEQSKRGDVLGQQLREQGRESEGVVRNLDRDLREQLTQSQQRFTEQLAAAKQEQQQAVQALRETLLERFGELKQGIEQRHGEGLKALNDNLRGGIETLQRQVAAALDRNAQETGRRMDKLTESTDKRLQEISGQVDKRLTEGFEKTTATFADVLKRLALIDDAQKKITELSTNVVSLQEVLADRTSRGAFGEVQLHGLVRNALPESSYAMQFTLSNSARVDCMLFLPEPTGYVPIDSKFPLDNYRRKMDINLAEPDRKLAEREFVRNVRTHLQDISSKYILAGETANFAVMFIPAEAVFAEIHAHHPELIEEAYKARVMLASPTTLWAILNTAGAVVKDAATRQQVHIIQEHLGKLAVDFERFQKRMGDLAKHIGQAHRDVEQVNTSARKITSRFTSIERLELSNGEPESVIEADVEEAPIDGDGGRSESAGA